MAWGARPGKLTWLVVREVTALVVAAIAIGSALSWAGLVVVQSSVGPILGANPVAVAVAALIISVSGAAAAYIPARRAVQADPLVAIRHQ